MKSGVFNFETLTVSFGGSLSKPHNKFEAKAIKVTDYSYTIREKECLGNGWYGTKSELTTHIESNCYVIIKDEICIGYMKPIKGIHKNILYSLSKKTNKHILQFLKDLNIK